MEKNCGNKITGTSLKQQTDPFKCKYRLRDELKDSHPVKSIREE